MSRKDVLYINGEPVEPGPRYVRHEPPVRLPPPVRVGCYPQCCGVYGSGNGGHYTDLSHKSGDCEYHPTPRRTFDHLAGESEDARFSKAAHAMRREEWWCGQPVLMVPDDVSGELEGC